MHPLVHTSLSVRVATGSPGSLPPALKARISWWRFSFPGVSEDPSSSVRRTSVKVLSPALKVFSSPVLCQVLSPPLPLQGGLVDRQHCVVVRHVAVAVDVPIVVAVLLAQQRSLWQMLIASIGWRRSTSNIISYSPWLGGVRWRLRVFIATPHCCC